MKIDLLRPAYCEAAAKVLIDAFQGDHVYNWGRVLNRPKEVFASYMINIYMPQLLKDTAIPSLVALEEDRSVMGALTLEDFAKSDQERHNEDTQANPITAILSAAHDVFWHELKIRDRKTPETAGKICYFAFLGVDERHRRKKVGEALVNRGCEEASTAGCSMAVAFCTSPKSAILFSNLGFTKYGEIVYKEFKLPIDGSTPFKEIPDATTIMVKHLI